MESQKLTLTVHNMVCGGCEDAVESALKRLDGVSDVNASHVDQQVAVVFDGDRTTAEAIAHAVRLAGYDVPIQTDADSCQQPCAGSAGVVAKGPSRMRKLLIFIGLLLVIGGIVQWGRSLMPGVMTQMATELSLATLFILGFFTGFHCIGMCGSFVVSYVDRSQSMGRSVMAHASYGVGKTLSYTLLGGVFGLAGALITVTPEMRGYAALFAGFFLLLFGLKMLSLFAPLRKLNLRFPKALTDRVTAALGRAQRPFVIGLLNGLLLGCGPLQAMYIMAAGTGSPVEGAMMLCFFGLGTLPALLGFGFFASYLSSRTIHDLMRVSGVLVILMGLMMINRGWMAIS
ncbi:MAG: heavy metal transport/detoxification protein [Gammaproteobacteria bacterium]|nr:heavy metal transport/detoxification protein [Gammaproteobacteria bacterium]|tara:strand:- start:1039 stop:2070 length:1032 start_codon:yes stop_codon:yes gene_type:complete